MPDLGDLGLEPVVGEDHVDDPGRRCGRPAPRRGRRGRSRRSRRPGSPRCRRRPAARGSRGARPGCPGSAGSGAGSCRGCPGRGRSGPPRRSPSRASSDGWTSAGVSQTREIPLVRMISDCPWIDEPSAISACSVSGVPEAGTTCPRTARTRLTWRTPSSKSPPSIAVIAAISRFPTGWPAEPGRVRARVDRGAVVGAGEAVLEDVVHQRLRVGERRDAVADVADGRDAQRFAQHARRAAVVGDRDDGRQVAGVLLEAAQQRGKPRPAADGHDPRAAREEPLLVDELDERGRVRVRASERVHEGADHLDRADDEDRQPDAADDQPAQRVRQELQGQGVDQRARAARLARGRG